MNCELPLDFLLKVILVKFGVCDLLSWEWAFGTIRGMLQGLQIRSIPLDPAKHQQ